MAAQFFLVRTWHNEDARECVLVGGYYVHQRPRSILVSQR